MEKEEEVRKILEEFLEVILKKMKGNRDTIIRVEILNNNEEKRFNPVYVDCLRFHSNELLKSF